MKKHLIIATLILTAGENIADAATLYLRNPTPDLTQGETSGSLVLGPGESGTLNIMLDTSANDPAGVAFINAFLDMVGPNCDADVTAVSHGQTDPQWTFDASAYKLPCEVGDECDGSGDEINEYGLVFGSSAGPGFPVGTNATYIIDSLTVTNTGTGVGDLDVFFEGGARKPAAFGPPPTYTPFFTNDLCLSRDVPGFLYFGVGDYGAGCANPFVIQLVKLADCNNNGVPDGEDIAVGTSFDCQPNAIPDECELDADCNSNSVPDECDISSGQSDDCQPNTIPDECELEADCNTNSVPDECDVSSGQSNDCQPNAIPDECEPDCNQNFIADECDILSGSSLDCQADGVPDECQLGPESLLLVASKETDSILAYSGTTGEFVREFIASGAGGLDYPNGVVIDSIGDVYVASVVNSIVIRYSGVTGGVVRTYSGGGLSGPVGLLLGEPDSLLVSSYNTDSVLEFNRETGEFIGTFVESGSGGINGPGNLVVGPNGNLYIPGFASDSVVEYDGFTGDLVGVVVPPGANGLNGPSDVLFDSEGNFLVTNSVNDSVLKYTAEGVFLGAFISSGSGGLDLPEALLWTPEGTLLITSYNTSEVLEYSATDGSFLGVFASGGGLDQPTYMTYLPLETGGADCQFNGVPDDCDIAEGDSPDFNDNGVPDECDPDCQDNGLPDFIEIIFGFSEDCNINDVPDDCDLDEGTSADCNENDIPDDCDIIDGTSGDCDFDGVPDECEAECNGNGVPDDCDIADGTSADCNGNTFPDECDLSAGASLDCNGNAIPDECEVPPIGPKVNDCNGNGVPDDCDLASGTSGDCQPNGIPDECDLADGDSDDVNDNDLPDECEPPVLLSAASLVGHGNLGELTIDLALAGPISTDPRLAAGAVIEIRLEGAVDPDLAEDEENITIVRASGGVIDPADILAELNDGGTLLTLTFPGLPQGGLADRDRYLVDLSAIIAEGDADFEFRLLIGDVTGNNVVDPLDAGAVLSRFGEPIAPTPGFDVNNDGIAIDPLDVGAILSRFGNSTP